MTDYYKTSLEVLAQILKEEKYDHWANWMLEDIKLWETNKSVEHHLHAYGGMGSFNDIVIGGNDNAGIWKSHVFGNLQTLAYSLAKGNALESILEGFSNRSSVNEISGWRCRNCGDARMTDRDINLFIAYHFVPKFFVECIQEDRFKEIIDIPKLVDSKEVITQKNQLIAIVKKANIIFDCDNEWLWTCPNCSSSEVCAYRWNVSEEDVLVEGDNNLRINHS